MTFAIWIIAVTVTSVHQYIDKSAHADELRCIKPFQD